MKYSKEELKEKSMTFLWHDGAGTMEANMLLVAMRARTGLDFEQIRYRVRELAKAEANED